MIYYDAHNFLHDARLDSSRDHILREAAISGIGRMIVNGTEPADWDAVLALARRYPNGIISSLGLHPWNVGKDDDAALDRLEHELRNGLLGVGEIGLDRAQGPDIKLQDAAFRAQWRLAGHYDAFASVHCVRAWDEFLNVLQTEPPCRFLVHYFSAPPHVVHIVADRGGYFSFSPKLMSPKREKMWDIFRVLPADRLLIESDAPGNNADVSPTILLDAYRFLAELRDIPLQQFVPLIAANFNRILAE